MLSRYVLIILEVGVSAGRKDEDKNQVFFAVIFEYVLKIW